MTRKGRVTQVNSLLRTARVVFHDVGSVVTAEIPYAEGLTLSVNDDVATVFFSESLADGLIIAVF